METSIRGPAKINWQLHYIKDVFDRRTEDRIKCEDPAHGSIIQLTTIYMLCERVELKRNEWTQKKCIYFYIRECLQMN